MSLRSELKNYLTHSQRKNGWFTSYAIAQEGELIEKNLPTPYFSFIIGSLLSDPRLVTASTRYALQPLLKKLLIATTKERSKENTYNYWLRTSIANHNRPIPDDWDDTALAYSFLYHYPAWEKARAFPLLKKALLPNTHFFQTWIFSGSYPEKWLDSDLWVNLNICTWLAQEKVVIGPVWEHCCHEMQQRTATSRYYLDYAAAGFFFSRAAELILNLPEAKQSLTKRTLRRVREHARQSLNKKGNTLIQTAWYAATLPKSEGRAWAEKAAKRFLRNVPIEPVILGWQQPGKVIYDCCPPLTGALLLLALEPNEEQKILADCPTPRFSRLPKDEQRLLKTIQKSDFAQEVVSLPYEIASLGKQVTNPQKARAQSRANLLAWLYYWLDDQEIDHHPLPFKLTFTPQIVYEQYIKIENKLIPKKGPYWQYHAKIEKAYEKAAKRERNGEIPPKWTAHHQAKFGPYLRAVHASLIIENREAEAKPLIEVYRHYLLAKQWSDDSHDCLEDIRSGRLTVCTTQLQPHLKKGIEEYADLEIEQLFLAHAAGHLITFILRHIKIARTKLLKAYGEKVIDSSLYQRISALEHRTERLVLQRRDVAGIQAAAASVAGS